MVVAPVWNEMSLIPVLKIRTIRPPMVPLSTVLTTTLTLRLRLRLLPVSNILVPLPTVLATTLARAADLDAAAEAAVGTGGVTGLPGGLARR